MHATVEIELIPVSVPAKSNTALDLNETEDYNTRPNRRK